MSHSSRRVFPNAFRSFSLHPVVAIGVIGCLAALHCQTAAAQSSVVQLPDSSNAISNNSRVTRMVSSQLPNDLPEALLQTERALARPMPNGWATNMSFERLLEQMAKSGLRFKLDESAIDSNLDEESMVLMQLPGKTISENFSFLLGDFGCDYRITKEGTIQILSGDAILDSLDRVTFSIGGLVSDYQIGEEVMDYLQETIDPDSWEANGGNGRMRITRSKRGFLMTVTQTYPNLVRIRQQLISMIRLGGGVSSPEYVVGSPSRSVALPVSDSERGWAPGRSFRRGRGVGGLGGGVF